MSIVDRYKTLASVGEAVFKDKGSKFLAFAYHVDDEEQVKEYQKNLRKKYYDARHHVYAFRLSPTDQMYRASDDGEPANSSGPPVLGQIKSLDLYFTLVVVVRYFGGTKLGIPGLINAYKTAAQMALENAQMVEKVFTQDLTIQFPYELMNEVQRLSAQLDIEPAERIFGQDVTFTYRLALNSFEEYKQKFENLHKLVIL